MQVHSTTQLTNYHSIMLQGTSTEKRNAEQVQLILILYLDNKAFKKCISFMYDKNYGRK